MKPDSIVVGLGNPGERYERTRHNLGFRAVDAIVRSDRVRMEKQRKRWEAVVQDGVLLGDHEVNFLAMKPQTFMNESGVSVAACVRFFKLDPNAVMVLHDDVDLPFGELRQAFDRGSAGHQGVESIAERLGTLAFRRIRIGVGSNRETGVAAEDYVLQPFTPEQESRLEEPHGVLEQLTDLFFSFVMSEIHR